MRKLMTERNGLDASSGETGSGPFIAIVLAALPVVAAVMLFAGRRDHLARSDEPAAVSNDPSLARGAATQDDAADPDTITTTHEAARAEHPSAAPTAEKANYFTRWIFV